MNAPVRLHYRTWGGAGKPPVLFLHGFLGSSADWDPVAQALSNHFHCIAVDLPGHGSSPLPSREDDTSSFDCFAAGLLELADRLGLKQFALVGYSMGGRLALHTASQAQERLTALVLESASPGLSDGIDREARREHDRALAETLDRLQGDDAAYARFLRDWYAQPLFSTLAGRPGLLEDLIARRSAASCSAMAAALLHYSVSLQPSHWEALRAWTVPTLVLAGEADRKYVMIAESMSEASARIAVEVFAGCSHNVHLENPVGYTTALNQFLDSTWKRA